VLTEGERRVLDEDGYVILTGLLTTPELARMRQAVGHALERAPSLDPLWRPGGTLHVDLEQDPAFAPVRESARLRAALSHLLGRRWELTRLTLRAPQPGFGAQVLHGAATLPPAKRGVLAGERPTLVTAIVALVDFTSENGATRVVPGSHRTWSLKVPADPDAPFREAKVLSCPAGSAIVFPEALVHSGTRNRSQQRRDSLQVSYSPSG
jgi:ectoine hydroxylase-related dioxygenase (phytanoyl-CoA dioxygenase family)